MNKILKTSLVLLFFSISMLLFQISCDNEVEATPSVASDVQPLKLLFFYKLNPATGRTELWSANYDGTQSKFVFVPPTGREINEEFPIGISPDGSKIFLTLILEDGLDYNLSVNSINPDGSGLATVISTVSGAQVSFAGIW